MNNAIIEGNTATLELKVKIPRHYYEFFKYLEETHGFDSNRLAKDAADGIIMDANAVQEALHEAFGEADAIIKPELSICSKSFKIKVDEQVKQSEDRRP